eukprot:325593-Chlamydomonas_euryale.AAC.4
MLWLVAAYAYCAADTLSLPPRLALQHPAGQETQPTFQLPAPELCCAPLPPRRCTRLTRRALRRPRGSTRASTRCADWLPLQGGRAGRGRRKWKRVSRTKPTPLFGLPSAGALASSAKHQRSSEPLHSLPCQHTHTYACAKAHTLPHLRLRRAVCGRWPRSGPRVPSARCVGRRGAHVAPAAEVALRAAQASAAGGAAAVASTRLSAGG